jgi:hypothetical protein
MIRPPPRVAWAGVLALMAMLGLLAALHHVTRESVREGERRRVAAATYWQASWQCSQLPGPSRQKDCLARLHEEAPAAVQ